MKNKKKIIRNFISFAVIALIFYFFAKNLFLNWNQIKEYQFSLNFSCLIFSFIFLFGCFFARGLVWKKIVNLLEPRNDLGWLEAIRIDSYSQLGRYLPGKVFGVIGKFYLARNKNISKMNLYLSVVYDAVFHPVAAFLLSIFLIGFFFQYNLNFPPSFFLIGFSAVIGAVIVSHPKVSQRLINLFLKKTKKEPIKFSSDLSWLNKLKIIFYYSLVEFASGLGFFYLINSLTFLSYQNLLSMAGVYILSAVLGFIAFFAPGGLGIKEGVLVLFLKAIFPLNIAILITLLARIWTSLADLSLAGGFWLFNRLKLK